jgi:hypothetical protein
VALEHLYEHPWCAKAHTLPKLLRPRPIGEFFSDDGVPDSHDLMDEATMQTLAMGREFPLARGLTSPDGEIPLAVFPVEALLPALLDASFFIVVLRIVRTPLPVHLTLKTADRLGIRSEFSTEQPQAWSALARDNGNRGRSEV